MHCPICHEEMVSDGYGDYVHIAGKRYCCKYGGMAPLLRDILAYNSP